MTHGRRGVCEIYCSSRQGEYHGCQSVLHGQPCAREFMNHGFKRARKDNCQDKEYVGLDKADKQLKCHKNWQRKDRKIARKTP